MSKLDQIKALRLVAYERQQSLAKQRIVEPKPKAKPEVIDALRTEIKSVANKVNKPKTSRTNVANISDDTDKSRTSKQERQKKYREENKEKLKQQAKERMRKNRAK
jgi:hypothetical protein